MRKVTKRFRLGELENTIFVFTSDNGLLNGEHGMVDKRTMHEPSIHIRRRKTRHADDGTLPSFSRPG